MDKEEKQTETNTPVEETKESAPEAVLPAGGEKKAPRGRMGREFKKNPRRSPRKETRVKPEFDHKTVSVRRVTRVVAGGRRFSFSVTLVAGNRKGVVGVGQGKAADTPVAVEKAFRAAKKNLLTIRTDKNMSIPHEVYAKFGSSRVAIFPAPSRGILAGSSARIVLELAGLGGVNAKILSGSKNKVNIAKATIKALSELSDMSPRKIQ